MAILPELADRIEWPAYGSYQTTPWEVTVIGESKDARVLEFSASPGNEGRAVDASSVRSDGPNGYGSR